MPPSVTPARKTRLSTSGAARDKRKLENGDAHGERTAKRRRPAESYQPITATASSSTTTTSSQPDLPPPPAPPTKRSSGASPERPGRNSNADSTISEEKTRVPKSSERPGRSIDHSAVSARSAAPAPSQSSSARNQLNCAPPSASGSGSAPSTSATKTNQDDRAPDTAAAGEKHTPSFAEILEELPGLARLAAHDPHFEYRARNLDGDRVQCNGCSRWMKIHTWEKHLTGGCRVYVIQPVLPVPARRLIAQAEQSGTLEYENPDRRTSPEPPRLASTPSVEPETAASTASPTPAPPRPKIRQKEGGYVQCDACGKWMKGAKWNTHLEKGCGRVKKPRQKRWVYVEED